MFNFDLKKINFEEELGSGISGKVYPYQNDPSDKQWVVKHIVTDQFKDLCHHVNNIVLGFNCDHLNVLSIKGYLIEFNQQKQNWDIYIKVPRMATSIKKVIERHIKDKSCITEEVVVKYFYDITRALQYLHGKGIDHEGLKPETLLLDENDILKVTDFGLGDLANGGGRTGFLDYAAPENRDKDLFKDDYWGLGMVMLELCNLDVEDLRGMRSQVDVTEKVQRLSQKHKDRYKKELFDLISGLLKREPSCRINLEDVEKCLETSYPETIENEKKKKQVESGFEIKEHPEMIDLDGIINNLRIELEESRRREIENKLTVDRHLAKIKRLEETVDDLKRERARTPDGIIETILSGLKFEYIFSLFVIIALAVIIKELIPLFSNEKKCHKVKVNGKVQGFCVWPDGKGYIGEYEGDLRHGNGTYVGPNGYKYVGEWSNDLANGYGINTWPDGDRYEGEYRDDMFHGNGTYIFSYGSKYFGEFQNSMFHGNGTFENPFGHKYVGEWKEGKKKGQGILINEDRYEGEFQDDMFNGSGTMIYSDGRKYVGEWKNDKQEGQGTLTWPNGDCYQGEFHENQLHGKGTLTSSNGDIKVGQWSSGEFIGLDMQQI